jgi:hypothetical protein
MSSEAPRRGKHAACMEERRSTARASVGRWRVTEAGRKISRIFWTWDEAMLVLTADVRSNTEKATRRRKREELLRGRGKLLMHNPVA